MVLAVTAQSFAMGLQRGDFAAPKIVPLDKADTVIYDNSKIWTKFRGAGEKAAGDSLEGTGLVYDGPELTARDTIHAPDSLRYTDPFRYKYYVALVDSLTHKQVRDSLIAAGDSLDWPKLDSIYYADSAALAKRKFEEWYNSLDKDARKRYDYEQKMKRKIHEMDSIYNIKDSLQAIKDSIRENKPRILETYAFKDDQVYSRIFLWNSDKYFNDPQLVDYDTTYNYWFNDYKFMRNDINASYLGIAGSPVQTYDFFKRESGEGVSFYAPYEVYSFSPSTLPMYNTKMPYTELSYWGTLFANTEREESDIHLLTTQNLWPSLNVALGYDRTGANGMLESEDTDNRTMFAAANWLGKKYIAHGGYIYNKIRKSENGGIMDSFWIRDTTVGSREIDVYLTDADNVVKKNTFFLNQTYRIPFTFIKTFGDRKELRAANNRRKTILATGDSAALAEVDSLIAKKKEIIAAADTLDTDVTTAFIGHNSEYSVYSKVYTDNITSSAGQEFYNNAFYINPTTSRDSLRVMKLENRVFIKLQPWSDDAIVSSVNAGIGNRTLNHYLFSEDGYLTGGTNTVWSSFYIYGGAKGTFRDIFKWNADGYYTFMGKQVNDFGVNANASVSFYPFRRARKSPLSIKAHFETSLKEPDFYAQNYYSNHLKWSNDFGKISTTKVEGSVDIPYWKFSVNAGYALLGNSIYYDTLSIARQHSSVISVAKVGVRKDFQLWKFHFDNKALFQVSSNSEVMPLPTLALNMKWYLQFDVVKNVMQMQLGANMLYTSAWYAPAYNPELGQFHNQNKEKFGDCPYIDAFINIQWKRACIFVKLVNANMGWPMKSADYFSAAGFIRPQRAFKFGIWWPFYLQSKANSSVSGKAGSSLGGSSSSGSSSSRSGSANGRSTNRTN